MSAAVLLDDVSKVYRRSWGRGELQAVADVSLEIAEGEAFGFVGPNGAGKSTTIKMLVGAIAPTGGKISIFGRDVADFESRRGLAYVPENPCLYDYLTPLEILTMGLQLHGLQIDRPTDHCLGWLERFSLAHVARKPIRTFSKGMTQRVALAHAMAVKPRLLVLDEPLSGLDPIGRREVVDIVAEYNRAGGTVFFSSHVLHDVERLADRFGLIHQGRLITIRSPRELSQEQGRHFVVVYQGEQLPGAQELKAGLFELRVTDDVLPEHIAKIVGSGFFIKEVRPVASLETVFFDVVRHGTSAQEKDVQVST